MDTPDGRGASGRFTALSDRFRSVWTFYQFLGGVYKHRDEGALPYTYDFQGFHKRMEELIPSVGVDDNVDAARELDQMERELDRVQRELARIETGFPPSALRRFFDHIKRQDEKVLAALIKFYLMSTHFEQDTLDKLDILFTRIAEAPTEEEHVAPRDEAELFARFSRLAEFADLEPLPEAEAAPLVEAVKDIRRDLDSITDYESLARSKVYERYRRLKQRFGRTAIQPKILVEIVNTNIVAKNRFRELYRSEEARVLENTTRINEIERYLERHPDLANDELKSQIEAFRRHRIEYDASRREDNVKRENIAEMTSAMKAVLAQFDPASKRPLLQDEPTAVRLAEVAEGRPHEVPDLEVEEDVETPPESRDVEDQDDVREAASLTDVLPSDPLLNETLHKIMFALEMVVWDYPGDHASKAPEIHNLDLEPWEIDTYRALADREVDEGTAAWELERFFLSSAALRVKMRDEQREIIRLEASNSPDRLFEVLERSAQSLERAREVDRRFQWFIDDMLFRGDTVKLEQIYRSRFRFLNTYSGLWLDHQRSGGLTPL